FGSRVKLFIFVSSRRRHTRFSRDWSSDVCSSDLQPPPTPPPTSPSPKSSPNDTAPPSTCLSHRRDPLTARCSTEATENAMDTEEIGRASCRERGESRVDPRECETITERAVRGECN